MDPMKKLISFYSALHFDDLPEETVEATKALVIDALGCALAGSNAPLNPEIAERHASWGGKPEATVFVFGYRLPAPIAAWLNAALIHANDFDDTHDGLQNHVFVTLLPATLAAGESMGTPLAGKTLIAALAGAAELSLRLNLSVNAHIHPGWLPTTVFGSIGAAAGSAKIMGLDGDGIANAVGFGYAQAQGNRQALLDGSHAKRLQPAFSARAGVQAAVLAEVGATGPHRIVEGEDGVFALFGNGKGDITFLTKGLGKNYVLEEIGTKPYPCCRCSHPNISAAIEACAKLGPFAADAVESVDVWITPISDSMIGRPFQIRQNPQVDAQFSAQWTTAFALLHGAPSPPDFEPEAVVAGTETIRLAEKIKVNVWEKESLLIVPSKVCVRLKDGRSAEVVHDKIKGGPEWPLSAEERREKFLSCAKSAAFPLSRPSAEEALASLERLDEAEDIRPVIEQLSAVNESIVNNL